MIKYIAITISFTLIILGYNIAYQAEKFDQIKKQLDRIEFPPTSDGTGTTTTFTIPFTATCSGRPPCIVTGIPTESYPNGVFINQVPDGQIIPACPEGKLCTLLPLPSASGSNEHQ